MSAHISLTFLLVKVTVDISLHFGVVSVCHPGQVLTGDRRTSLIVKSSAVRMGLTKTTSREQWWDVTKNLYFVTVLK